MFKAGGEWNYKPLTPEYPASVGFPPVHRDRWAFDCLLADWDSVFGNWI